MPALQNLKILDLTRALAGPFCTLMLGDQGADIIKIELPQTGDDTRHWGPPFIQTESAYFLSINRNKRSLTLNFKEPEARQIFLQLAAHADAIVENFTPGVMERFGLGYDTIRSANPQIIYAAISGFGQTGPYRPLPAYDQIMQGISGLMSLTGEPHGEPQKVGIAVSDIGAGMWAAFAIMAAAHHRNQHGQGQYLDISMLDGQVAWLTYQAAYLFATGQPPARLGAAHPNLCPYQAFMCQDNKYLNLAVGSERIWERFRDAMQLDQLSNPQYATNGDRVTHRHQLVPYLQQTFLTQPVAQWVETLQKASVPCGPINDLADVFADPQIQAREMLQEMTHPTLGPIQQTGIPIKFSQTPGQLRLPPPLLGQHNHEILTDLGYSPDQIASLKQRGVI